MRGLDGRAGATEVRSDPDPPLFRPTVPAADMPAHPMRPALRARRTIVHANLLTPRTHFVRKGHPHDLDGRTKQLARTSHRPARRTRSEEHTSELQSLMRTSYAVFCLN